MQYKSKTSIVLNLNLKWFELIEYLISLILHKCMLSAEKLETRTNPVRNEHTEYPDCGLEIPFPINRNQASCRNG